MEHVVLIKKTPALTENEADQHIKDAAALVRGIPCVTSASGGRAVDTKRAQGFTHMLVVRLKLTTDLNFFTKHQLNKRAVKKHISPVVGPGSVEEKYARMIKLDIKCNSPNRDSVSKPSNGTGLAFIAGILVSAGLFAGYSMYKDGKIKLGTLP